MKKSDWMLVGIIGTVLGAIFLIGGICCSLYFEYRRDILGGYWPVQPYTKYAAPLLVSGIVLIVIGLGCCWRAEQDTQRQALKEITRVCPQCGRVLAQEVKFCPNCGKALESN